MKHINILTYFPGRIGQYESLVVLLTPCGAPLTFSLNRSMQRQFQNIPYDTNNMINNALFAQQVTTFKSLTIVKSLTTLFAHLVFFSNNLFIL